MPDKGQKRGNDRKRSGALAALAGTVVSGIVAVATRGTSNLALAFVAIGAICLVFAAGLGFLAWRERLHDRQARPVPTPPTPPTLDPDRLADALTPQQRDLVQLSLEGAVADIANVLGMRAEDVRSNIFARVSGANHLRMVKNLWYHMDDPEERTIQIEIGHGSTGIAWDTGNLNTAIWDAGWGASDLGNDRELAKVHPELRWILSAPVVGSSSRQTKLVFNVDGLRQTPTASQLVTALGHLPRFPPGIARALHL